MLQPEYAFLPRLFARETNHEEKKLKAIVSTKFLPLCVFTWASQSFIFEGISDRCTQLNIQLL